MMSQTGQEIITIHILPNISRTKGNQAIKFGQLIKYSMRNFFFSKFLQKMRQGDQFKTSKNKQKQKNQTKFITFQTIYPEICAILISYKKVWDQLLHHTLCMIFQEKYLSFYILVNCPNFIVFLEILGKMCIIIICCLVCSIIYFKIKVTPVVDIKLGFMD